MCDLISQQKEIVCIWRFTIIVSAIRARRL